MHACRAGAFCLTHRRRCCEESAVESWQDDPVFDVPGDVASFLRIRHLEDLDARCDGNPQPWLTLPVEIWSIILQLHDDPLCPPATREVLCIESTCHELCKMLRSRLARLRHEHSQSLEVIRQMCTYTVDDEVIEFEEPHKRIAELRSCIPDWAMINNGPYSLPQTDQRGRLAVGEEATTHMLDMINLWVQRGSLQHLTSLSIGLTSKLDDPEVRALSNAIQVGGLPSLRILSLQYTQFGMAGSQAIGDVAGQLASLQELTLDHFHGSLLNAIADGALPQLKSLEKTIGWGLPDELLPLMVRALHAMERLEVLNIEGSLDLAGASAIIAAVKNGAAPSLKVLAILGDGMSKAEAQEMKSACAELNLSVGNGYYAMNLAFNDPNWA